MRYDYDMLGNRIHQASMEAGERWMLNDVTGKPIRAWDSRGFTRRITYDELRRPTELFVTENGAEAAGRAHGVWRKPGRRRTTTGRAFSRSSTERASSPAKNTTSRAICIRSTRDLLPDYKMQVNWLQNPAANDGSFTTTTEYDALNRPTAITTPDNSIYRPTYNEANLLDKVEVNLRGAAAATPFVTNIDYNAKGQRTLIHYGNGAETTYEYDDQTFRLIHLKTTRPPGQNGDALADLRERGNRAGPELHLRPSGQHHETLKTLRC